MGEAAPAVFIGHGSPMNTLQENRYTQAWADFARHTPRPAAIVAISAHWYTQATAVTGMATPRTIHDFSGFGDELNAFLYPAPGSPELAARVADLLTPTTRVEVDETAWGLDHGTWSVLAHMYPDADVPVVQLSIDATKTPEQHIALGAALGPLRREGVVILGSGNVVHNLRLLSPSTPDRGLDWAEAFDAAATELMGQRPRDAAALWQHPHFDNAAPTPEHLVPLLYIAGLAAGAGKTTRPFAAGCAMGSLSMTCHALD